MATAKKELRTFYVKLAKLDEERKAILREIKAHPAYAIDYIKEAFRQKENIWFVRDNGTGKPMSVTEADRVIRFTDIVINQRMVNAGQRNVTRAIKKIRSTMFDVRLTTQNLNGTTYQTSIQVSVDKPILPQLFQSMHELTPIQLKKIQKDLAKFEAESIKKEQIKQLEDTIAKAQAELKKLKTAK
jgi:hypothetical protein